MQTLESDKKSLKEEAETLQIKAGLLRVKARSVETLSTEILKEGTEILSQIKRLAEINDRGEFREKLLKVLEPLKSHFLHRQNT